MPRTIVVLCCYLESRKGQCTGVSFIDSTPIQVCKPKRMSRNKTFQGFAKKGKSTIGWFFGFKLHLVVNDQGELLSIKLTAANVDDRKPVLSLTKKLFGKIFGDKGYIWGHHRIRIIKHVKDLIVSQRSEFPFFHHFVSSPNIVTCQIYVFPTKRR